MIDKDQEQKKQMPPDEYFTYLKSVSLEGIYLVDCSATYKPTAANSGNVVFEPTVASEFVGIEDGHARLRAKHTLTGRAGKAVLVKFRVEYDVILAFNSDIPQEFFEIYARHNLPMQTIPFWREWIASTSARMPISPIIVPLYVSP